jgi:hypothetical protein
VHREMKRTHVTLSIWHEIIGDPTYADAILDRLVHNAHRTELAGDGMRRVDQPPPLARKSTHGKARVPGRFEIGTVGAIRSESWARSDRNKREN